MANPLTALFLRFARRLRFPYLFALSLLLFLVDLAVPDIIPFADEIFLGLLTLLLGSRKQKDRQPDKLQGG